MFDNSYLKQSLNSPKQPFHSPKVTETVMSGSL